MKGLQIINLLDAIVYIANQNLIHGDIKPGNILVSNRDGRLRAFVGDFGLTGKSGGTPIFMAPEGLNKDSRIKVKTDLYSFAIMVLFLMFPAELAIKLLFLPIEENSEELTKNLSEFHLLLWIVNSVAADPEHRADFESWKVIIREMKTFDENWLKSRIDSEILERNGVDFGHLEKALEKEGGLYFYILDYFGYDIRSSKVNGNEAYKMSTAISKRQKLSLLQSLLQIGIITKGLYFDIFAALKYFFNSAFSRSRPRNRNYLLGLRYFDHASRFD